ncbi:carbohydrate-binding module family 50 protein [Amanita muscaria Koide BX008]|uniref:Carbohydrate-binding module family 50 protein n=1 Tax=Amanita muscaria (strain Koide BX008) TaxID=946122 RepID=A0A0C2WSN7_AMAMK|nr:carbohydrate-binding module family 50 protein [Amanita muscaria Koide BX008]
MFAKAIISAFLALPLVAQTGLAAQCSRGYTVKEGDICDSISAANQVSTYQLAVINKGVIDAGCTNLVPGQTLCLANVGEDCNNIHVVALGDDCESVQNQAGINSTLLYHNNPQINENCSNIYVGEARFLHFVLCVAGGVQVPPTPSGGPPKVIPPATAIPANPSATAVHQPAPSSDGGDDNLPYCDEL